jgi:S1-C subfamily serine protease
MFRFRVAWAAATVATVLAAASIRADGLARPEIVKRGKAATALVQLPDGRSAGTAFCVHSSGLFLTSGRFVPAAPDAVLTLVLSPGLSTQKILKARAVRVERDADLALLRAEGAHTLPAIALGSANSLSELTELVTFGFPPGPLAPDRPDYPAISVDVGLVSSLPKKSGELAAIVLKGSFPPGLAGGPVLDDHAAVVGMTQTMTREGNRAVPVNRLVRFLAAPDFQFRPPALSPANEHEAQAFEVRVTPILPSPRPLSVDLILQAGDGPERQQPMQSKEGAYRVSMVPVPADPARLEVTV